MKARLLPWLLYSLCSAEAIWASDPVSLIRTERWSMVSEQNQQTYRIDVSLPKAAEADPEQALPLIVVLDADYAFALTRNLVEHLSDRDRIPAALVVGVGYPEGIESIPIYRQHRTRDYTPTHHIEGQYGPEIMKYSGGGPAFYRFLKTELLPELQHRYRFDRKATTLVGHSFGGLFASYALSRPDSPFRHYLIVSPSLWFDHRALLKAFEANDASDRKHSVKVFLAVGAMEAPEMTTDLRRMQAALCQTRSVAVWTTVFADEHHDSVFPVALSHGLRLLNQERMPPAADVCPP